MIGMSAVIGYFEMLHLIDVSRFNLIYTIWIDRVICCFKRSITSKGFAVMSDKVFDFLVFIGRFQPFHLGHLSVVRAGLHQAKHLIVLCGSAHQPRTTRNPWTFQERESMIRGSTRDVDQDRLHVLPLMDIMYNDESWVRNVQSTVNGIVTSRHGVPHRSPKIGLIGHSKDESSFYLNLFPQWDSVNVENCQGISATAVREKILNGEVNNQRNGVDNSTLNQSEVLTLLPAAVQEAVEIFSASESFCDVKQEYEFIAKYKKSWSVAPYTPTFVTVDAIVVQSGHVLMVERKARPGKGLLALPGGFVDGQETLMNACIRELREETRLKIPVPVLKGSVKSQHVFDDPYRSSRGRTITHAFYIELEPSKELPRVKGGDDAKYAMWVPLADLDPARIYEDHYFIIQYMTGL
ncbi:Bifunctional NMN adenylyltransferase/Nudix hydrolase [Thalassocella blandensis]|nr:Bifunctional NMN adenylyltransferase/Nudix hydrolase [Thalassocella blandensis]